MQDAYSLRCAPQVHGAARDTARRTPRPSPSASWPSAIDNPVVLPDGRVESQRQLPRRARRLRARLPRHRRRRRRVDRRAAHRPLARRRPQPRAAAVPRRTTRASTPGLMIAQYTPGRDRLRAASGSPPRPASTRSRPRRCRRTTSRWAGARPASCAAAIDGLTPRARHRAADRRPRRSTCARRSTPAPATAAVVAGLRAHVAGPRARPLPRARDRGGRRRSSRTGAVAGRRRVRHRPAALTRDHRRPAGGHMEGARARPRPARHRR